MPPLVTLLSLSDAPIWFLSVYVINSILEIKHRAHTCHFYDITTFRISLGPIRVMCSAGPQFQLPSASQTTRHNQESEVVPS
jgi:hypothetical protein